jgi:imidazoleglycerol-phosphate dehydratase / histidinol-phosphatase
MKKALFIDRDGTLIVEPADEQIDSLEKLEFLPGVFRNMSIISKFTDYELIMVSNQDGLGTDSFPEKTFLPPQQKMLKALENEGIVFSAIHIDPSKPTDKSPNRKPGTGMLTKYMQGDYDLEASYVIGDRITDVQLAKNLGAKAILIGNADKKTEITNAGLDANCALIAQHWDEISAFLMSVARKASVERKTNETNIFVEVVFDGLGKSSISTGLGFFDHMLEQISRHSGCSLTIKVNGDLNFDEHHTIEDTGLALGEAFVIALKDKRGMNRYGFVLPMDDCLAQVAIDFGGRSWLVWDVEFKREMIGDVPTEMFFHFFKSFTDAAKCNLNIKVDGDNEHHKAEAIFKAFAKTIKTAVKQDFDNFYLPSTKGVI